MRRIRTMGVAAAALLLWGCGSDEMREDVTGEESAGQAPYEELAIAADTAEGYEDRSAAPVTPVQGPQGPADATVNAPLTATGNLRGIAENFPPGTITVTDAGAGTQVLVAIDRYTPGTTLVATLTRGSCADAGQTVTRIGEPFTISDRGFATLDATIGVPARTILDGRHSIRINTPGRGAPEIVLACAEMPRVE